MVREVRVVERGREWSVGVPGRTGGKREVGEGEEGGREEGERREGEKGREGEGDGNKLMILSGIASYNGDNYIYSTRLNKIGSYNLSVL